MVSIPHQIETKCLTRVKSIYGMRKDIGTAADGAFRRTVVFHFTCKVEIGAVSRPGIEAQIAIKM